MTPRIRILELAVCTALALVTLARCPESDASPGDQEPASVAMSSEGSTAPVAQLDGIAEPKLVRVLN